MIIIKLLILSYFICDSQIWQSISIDYYKFRTQKVGPHFKKLIQFMKNI